MANKVISISTNSKKARKDRIINDVKFIDNISSNSDYVYMDIDMIASYRRNNIVSLSSVQQYDYILGTEKYKNESYQISALDSEDDIVKILLYSRSSFTVTKKIDDFINSLKNKEIDHSKVAEVQIDERHKVYVYKY